MCENHNVALKAADEDRATSRMDRISDAIEAIRADPERVVECVTDWLASDDHAAHAVIAMLAEIGTAADDLEIGVRMRLGADRAITAAAIARIERENHA